MKQPRSTFPTFFIFIFILYTCFGCSKTLKKTDAPFAYVPGQTHVLVPCAEGKDQVEIPPLTLDFSNKNQGYFTAILSSPSLIHIQLTGPDNVTYRYFLEKSGLCTAFPFTAGSGNYMILVFENIGGNQYTPLYTSSFEVTLENEFLPFLYPNQYVNFTTESNAVKLAALLSAEAETDLDALSSIYHYITENIVYDEEKASSVETGYLPDIDETLRTGKGICFDYAALTVSMLRSLSIPSRLNIGYSSNVYHAWVDVYIESAGWIRHMIEFRGNEWNRIDPTFAASMTEDLLAEYISDGENYIVAYVR